MFVGGYCLKSKEDIIFDDLKNHVVTFRTDDEVAYFTNLSDIHWGLCNKDLLGWCAAWADSPGTGADNAAAPGAPPQIQPAYGGTRVRRQAIATAHPMGIYQ